MKFKIDSPLYSLNQELQDFCDGLEANNVICSECKDVLKDNIHRLCIGDSDFFINANANETDDLLGVSLHALCVGRIVAQYRTAIGVAASV